MKPLNDRALERLREASELPDLCGTRYTMREELGRGGMGIVYLVRDNELDRDAALKILHLDDVSADLASRMRQEARTLAQLEHPGIVPIYDFGQLAGGRLYYVMRLVIGQRLDQFLGDSPALPDRLRVFEKICEALAFAHSRHVIHRDLKPSNIMLGSFGEVLVMDWGLARLANSTDADNRRAGTEGYMAPEQERGESTDERSDVFSLGRILERLLPAGAPKPLRSIAAKASATAREARYAAVSELSTDLLRYLDGLPVSAHTETLAERWQRFYSRNRTLVLLAAAYIVMRVLVLVFLRR